MINPMRYLAARICMSSQKINAQYLFNGFQKPNLLSFPLLRSNFSELQKESESSQSVEKEVKKKRGMSKVIKRANTISEPVSSQSSSQSQKGKKQAQLGDFFAGIKKKPEAVSDEKVEINKDLGDGIWKDRSSIKLACWNVNGLRAVLKREDLQNYIKKEDPDVLCLNETKIDESNFIKEKVYENIPKGYYQYWQN